MLDVAAQQRVVHLRRDKRRVAEPLLYSKKFRRLPGAQIRIADVAHEPTLHKVLQRARGLLKGCKRIRLVNREQVNVVSL